MGGNSDCDEIDENERTRYVHKTTLIQGFT